MKKWIIVAATLSLALTVSAEEAANREFETTLNAGLMLTDGNSETLAANVGIVTEGARENLGSVIAGIEANYGESTVRTEPAEEDGEAGKIKETTIDNVRAYVNVKKTLSPRTFASVDASALHDNVAAIDYRAAIGPGLGVYLQNTDRKVLTLEAGPSYVWEKVDGERDHFLALRAAVRKVCQATENAKLVSSLEYLAEAEDFDNYLLNAEVALVAALNDRLGLRLGLRNQYDNTPAAGKERNDLSVIAGLSFQL